jgi:hypothetical protein
MLHYADQLKLMLRHQQAQYLQFVARGLLQLHQLEVNEFDRPAATAGASSSLLFSRPTWGAFPPAEPGAAGSGSLYAGGRAASPSCDSTAGPLSVQRAASLPSQAQLYRLQQQQQQQAGVAGSLSAQARNGQPALHVQPTADSHSKGLQPPQGPPSARQHLTSPQQKRRWSVGALVMAHTRSPLSSPRGSATGTESSSPRTFLHSSRAEALERKRPASTTAADDDFDCSLPGVSAAATAAGQEAATGAAAGGGANAAGEVDSVWDLASQLDDFFLPVRGWQALYA